MHRLPTKLTVAAWLIVFSTACFGQSAQEKAAAASPSQVQADLLRGLADIFS
jgi:hypothetical protein